MTPEESKAILDLIDSVLYGEVIIKKEAGRIVLVRKTSSIKLNFRSDERKSP